MPSAPVPEDRSRASAFGYLIAVLLLPAIVLWRQDNTLFTGYGYLDPWFYQGFFRNLVEFKRNLFPATYYGSRLSWLLPGAALQSLFPPVVANCILHLGVHTVATVALFLTLKWMVGARRAFLGAMLFSVNPWMWSATGWDVPDGAGIAYCLLTMALLTWAALRPVRRWALVGAGMALACMVYSNLYWVALAWLPPAGYVALVWAWHRTGPVRASLALVAWFGAGCAAVTVALGAVNWFLDGHFFFYAPSVLAALRMRGDHQVWFGTPWIGDAPAPWLLFATVAAAAALAILAACGRQWTGAGNAAPVLFSAQLLFAMAWMMYSQVTDNPGFGIYYYASFLMPFTFLVVGTWFWPSIERLSTRAWVLVCAAAGALFGLVWLSGVAPRLAAIPHAAPVGIAVLLLSLALRRRASGVILSVAAFALFVAIGAAARYTGLEPHALRHQYESVMDARSRIESARAGAGVRFWYDTKDRVAPLATAISSTYIWSYSLVGPNLPTPDGDAACGVELPPSTLIAVLSSDGRQGQLAASTLAGCLAGAGLRARPAGSGMIGGDSVRCTLEMLRVETVPGAWTPVAPARDAGGGWVLEDSAGSAGFPLRNWALEPGGDSRAWLRPEPGGVRVRTHGTPGSLAAQYPAVRVQTAGLYRFAMRYWRVGGVIRFGASRAGQPGQWLASASRPYWDGNDPDLIFWVRLAAGEEFRLGIANRNDAPALPASFLMKGITAVRVADTAADGPR